MATENILIKFTSDTSGIKDSITEMQKLGKITEEDAKKFQMMEGIAEGVADALKEAGIEAKTLGKEVRNSADSGKTLKAQFAEAKNEAVRLSTQFGAFSKEARDAAKRAAELKDQIADMNGVLDALNPEAKLNAFVNLGRGVQGAFQAATGALQLFGVESEAVTKIAQQFQGVLNITQGINSVLQLKDVYTQLKLVLGVTTAATEGAKVATLGLAAAEDVATASTKSFTLALASNPITLVILGLIAAGVEYKNYAENVERAEKAIQDAKDKASQAEQDRIDEINARYKAVINGLKESKRLAEAQGESAVQLAQRELEIANVRIKGVKELIEVNGASFQLARQLGTFTIDQTIATINLKKEEYKAELALLLLRQAAIDRSNASQDALKAQFDAEFQAQTSAIDKTLQLEKGKNELLSKSNDERIKNDLVSEIAALERKKEKAEEFGKDTQEIDLQIALTKKKLRTQEQKEEDEARSNELSIAADFIESQKQLTQSFFDLNSALTQQEIAQLEDQKKQGIITEEQYQAKLKVIKNKAAQDQKAAAIFAGILNAAGAIINALNTVPNDPASIAAAVTLASITSALNLAKIIATPVPQFKKGTLNVGGGNLDADGGMHAVIHKGEAVIPADRNREYHPTIKALYNRSIKASDINSFVQMKLSGKIPNSINANIDHNKLGRAMKGSGVVEVGNAKAVGKVIASELSKNIDVRRW